MTLILPQIMKPQGFTKNLSTSGNAIGSAASSGSLGATADGITSGLNGWTSSETAGGVSGVSNIGQNFGVVRRIRRFVLFQGYNSDTGYCITSAKVQFSDNGSAWTDHVTVSPVVALGAQAFDFVGPALGHQYWRLLANSAPGAANRWGINELEMYERL